MDLQKVINENVERTQNFEMDIHELKDGLLATRLDVVKLRLNESENKKLMDWPLATFLATTLDVVQSRKYENDNIKSRLTIGHITCTQTRGCQADTEWKWKFKKSTDWPLVT